MVLQIIIIVIIIKTMILIKMTGGEEKKPVQLFNLQYVNVLSALGFKTLEGLTMLYINR